MLLARTELEEGRGLGCRGQGQGMEARVRRIYSFLASLNNGGGILSMVHQHILEHYLPVNRGPAVDWGDCIMASFPPLPQLHSICDIGLELLALTVARHVVQSLRVGLISPPPACPEGGQDRAGAVGALLQHGGGGVDLVSLFKR